jgi:hypothetical protein
VQEKIISGRKYQYGCFAHLHHRVLGETGFTGTWRKEGRKVENQGQNVGNQGRKGGKEVS